MCKFGGGKGSLERLKELAREKSDNVEVQQYLAKAYKIYGEEEKAAESYLSAASIEQDEALELQLVGESALSYARANNKEKLAAMVSDIKHNAKNIDSSEIIVLNILRDIAEIENEKTLSLAYSERMLDLKPEDENSRFNLAYGHSNKNRENLALYHYLKIPYGNRSSTTWNNIGVAYSNLDMQGKAVDAYEISKNKDDTLAMSNLAFKYMNAGFIKEAEQQCEKAKKIDDYHKNIDNALFKLKNKVDDESQKEKNVLEKINSVHEFYVKFGRAAAREDLNVLADAWDSKECPLKIKIENGKFSAHGRYEISTLATLLAGLNSEKEKKYCDVWYEGRITGYSIIGHVKKVDENSAKKRESLLDVEKNRKDILMIVSDDLSKIDAYQENAEYDWQKFQVITKSKE